MARPSTLNEKPTLIAFDSVSRCRIQVAIPDESKGQTAEPPEWPTHFPPNCPSPDIPATNGPVYHYVWEDEERDFKSAYDREKFLDREECQRVSLSCFVTLSAAVQSQRIIKGQWAGAKIACAELTPEHGRIGSTPTLRLPGHHSLWLRAKYMARCGELFRTVQ